MFILIAMSSLPLKIGPEVSIIVAKKEIIRICPPSWNNFIYRKYFYEKSSFPASGASNPYRTMREVKIYLCTYREVDRTAVI